MSFTPNLPATGQSLGFTKTPIKDNFAVIRSTIAANHYDVNDPLAGKHKFSVYPSQGTDPATTTTEAAIYTKTLGQVNAVFRSQDSAGTGGKVYQLTRAIDGSFASFSTATGWTFLPGGLLMQWGKVAGSAATTIPVVFPVPFTNPGYSIQILPERAATSPGDSFSTVVVTGTLSQTGFSIGNIGGHTMAGWYWTAIGK